MYLSPRNDEMAAGDPFIMSPAVIAGLGLPTDSRGNELVISGLVLSSIALFLVGIRIYGRAIVSRVVGWDDYWAIPAVV